MFARGWLVVCGSLWLLLPGPLAAAGPDGTGYFAGQTADGRGICLTVQRDGTNLTGSIHLEGSGTAGRLHGLVPTHKTVVLAGDDRYADFHRWAVTNLTGELTGEPAQWQGLLNEKSAPGGVRFSATNVASLAHSRQQLGIKLAGRGGGKEFTAFWPEFRGNNPYLRAVSARLAAEAGGKAGSFVTGGLGVAWEGLKAGGVSWSWAGTCEIQLACLATDSLSLYEEDYEETGGAHGNTIRRGRNFVFHDGKIAELELSKLFRVGGAWEAALSTFCLRELHHQKAASVVAGTVTKLKRGEMSAFTFNRSGLVIHFQDYQVGPHADGRFSIFVPWAEVRPWLDSTGPARYFPGAVESPPGPRPK